MVTITMLCLKVIKDNTTLKRFRLWYGFTNCLKVIKDNTTLKHSFRHITINQRLKVIKDNTTLKLMNVKVIN